MGVEKTMNIKVGGIDCTIITDEERGYILKIAGLVDGKIDEILESNARVSVAMASVLAAMHFCDNHLKSQEAVDNMRSQIKPYIDEAAKIRVEYEDCKKENDRLRRDIETLRTRLSNRR